MSNKEYENSRGIVFHIHIFVSLVKYSDYLHVGL